ncbi:MAG: pseudouridine synthase [Bacteroidota bacterium]
MNDDGSISLNKYISSTGRCSRRAADRMIEAGRVRINGQIAQKGNRILPDDRVTLDGKAVIAAYDFVYLAFHKPAGVTSTTDRRDRDNIIDFINYPKRIFPIGRLDKASTGLILLTNDGDIVNQILREENNHEKEYIVQVDRPISNRFLQRMRQGVPILGTVTKRCRVDQLNKQLFRIVLTQGLNRQIRRMCEYLGYKVLTLKRVRIIHINLDGLKVGTWRELTKEEMEVLRRVIR